MQKHEGLTGCDPGETLKGPGVEADIAAYTELGHEWSLKSGPTAVAAKAVAPVQHPSGRMGFAPLL